MKKKHDTFGEVFNQLKFNTDLEDLLNSDDTANDLEIYLQKIKLKKVIRKECVRIPMFKKSMLMPEFLFLLTELNNIGINEDNYQKLGVQSNREFAQLMFEILKAINKRKESAQSAFNGMKKAVEEHPKLVKEGLAGRHKIDLFRISGTMTDYFLLKDIKSILLKSETQFVKELFTAIDDFKIQLSNAISLITISKIDLDDTSFYTNANPLKSLRFKLTSSMQSELLKAINMVKELNSKIFAGSLNKRMLEELRTSIESIEDSTDFEFVFTNLHVAMEKETRLSVRSKKLLMHDIFKVYKHPRAITDAEEDLYLQKDESTIEKLEMKKLRVVEMLIPKLK